MGNTFNLLKKNGYILIFSILTILTYFVLFAARTADDNRLTSWQWTFNSVNITEIFLILLAGLIPAYLFSRVSFFERYPVICLFSLSYIIAALFWGAPEVIVDTSRYFTQAKYLEVYGIERFIKEWGKDIYVWTDMPLMPFLYGLIFKFFWEIRLYIQIFTTLLFAVTVVLTYLIGKELWSEEVGFFGGLFLLGMPYLLTQSPLMLVDIPTTFFLTLSVFTCIKALNRGGMWIGFSSIAIFLAFFSKYSTWPMLSVLVVIFVVYLITSGVQRSAFSVQRKILNSKL
jgi:4-amino-4-deoxy-L-arabinose transferase-like glycosyltransferase